MLPGIFSGKMQEIGTSTHYYWVIADTAEVGRDATPDLDRVPQFTGKMQAASPRTYQG
jgi:hypothetical protein